MPRYRDFDNLQHVVCGNCIPPIIEELDFYKAALMVLPDKCVFDPTQKTASIAISDDSELSDEELDAEIRSILSHWIPPKDEVKKNQYHLLQADIGIFFGATMMALMFANVEIPMWVHDLMLYGGVAIIGLIGYPSLKKAWTALWGKQKKINMDSLFALSTIAAIVASLLHPYFDVIPSLVDAALMINGFRHFGLWIEESFTQKVSAREKFVDRGRRSTFKIKQNGTFVDYKDALKNVPMNAVLQVPRGECIPLNGKLEDDSADVTFTMHTGKEDVECMKRGDQLLAGMIVASESVTLKVNALEDQSYLRARDLSLIAAQSKKAPIQEMTSNILIWFMPVVLFFAVAVGLLSGYFNGIGPGFQTLLYFMVCACPCALGMVTPLGVNVGLKKLSDDGVRFKTAKGMQAAAEVDTIVFDLNGTLTKNQPKVTRCTIDWRFFPLIHAMQAASTHNIGKAISDYMLPSKMMNGRVILDQVDKDHHGLMATFQGSIYKIGNRDFVNPPLDKQVKDFDNAQHAIYFSKNGVVEGYFLLDDPLRDGAKTASMIQNLIDNKMSVKVFTGASQDTAEQYAKQLGISSDCFVTDCVPTIADGAKNKCALIKALQEQGHKVAMFGDAGNDVEAIKAANFGVVVNSRSTDPMAEQESDASINSDTLLPQVLKLIAVGRQTMRHIKQNLAVSFAYNAMSLVYVGCAVFLKPDLLNPAFGAGLMVFQSLFIVLNAMRINLQEAKLPVEYKQMDAQQSTSKSPHVGDSPPLGRPSYVPQYKYTTYSEPPVIVSPITTVPQSIAVNYSIKA
ncbi:MAG: heavy metal translocating P-type ATPase [Gammaproteobacteria bacterium]